MSYVDATETAQRKTGQIKLHGPAGFAGMRKAGQLVARCLDELVDIVKPGVPTAKIDDFVREFAFSHGAYPATLMYRGYRYSTCTSLNHVVCHGMPGDRPLKEGDIVNVDVTMILDGWYGDSSRMYPVGPIARKAERLIDVTYESLLRGIAAVKPGATTGDIGHAIQSFVEPQQMSVVRDFCGHGLGRLFHDEPNIIHVGSPGQGAVLKPGILHHRADDQSRQAVREDPVRRLDRGDPRPLAVGAVRTFDRRHRRRLRDLHGFAQGPRQAAVPELSTSIAQPQRLRLKVNSVLASPSPHPSPASETSAKLVDLASW